MRCLDQKKLSATFGDPEKMWSGTIEWLKDARVVARIQEWFGVKIHYAAENPASDARISQEFKGDVGDSISLSDKPKTNGYNVVKRKVDDTDDEELKNDTEKTAYIEPSTSDFTNRNYTITNYFWYYLFLFGTELGDETFYSAFIPFWFWNIDAAVGRRMVLVWAIIMTTGQILKDIICWPRPDCPPAVRLQSKWSQEYGMPSTHAMVAVSIPFIVVLFTMNKYVYPVSVGLAIACVWCAVVSTSRLYLGMHTVLDVLVGLISAFILMFGLVPLVDISNYYIISNTWALVVLVTATIAVVVYFPSGKKWTPTRGDTTMVVSVTAGVHVGAWLNYQMGIMSNSAIPLPYDIVWPTYSQLGQLFFRTVLGFSCVIATKILCKSWTYSIMCAILNVNSKNLMKSKEFGADKNKILVDLVYKYTTCFMIGVNTVYLLPNVFRMIGIGRPTFFTEI